MKRIRQCRCCKRVLVGVGEYTAYCSDECRTKGRLHHLRLTILHNRTLRQLRGGLFQHLVKEEEAHFRNQVWK